MVWISHRCAQCGREAQLDASMSGQHVKCPACGRQGLVMPPGDSVSAAPVPSKTVEPPPIAIPAPPIQGMAMPIAPPVAATVMAPPPVQLVAAPFVPPQPMQRNPVGMLPNEVDDEWTQRRDRRRYRRNVVRFVAGIGALGLLVRLLMLLK